MRLPRDMSGEELARLLKRFGYHVSRQTGSHLRLSTGRFGTHHVSIPNHEAPRVGTLAGILNDIANHLDLPRDVLIRALFRK